MKQGLLYCCLSFVMMGLAMSHLTYLMPWVDEVMFMDTPMHYVKGILCLVFRSQARPFLAVPTIILYGDGVMDEHFRDNPDRLSFLEFNHYDIDWLGTSKDMPTVGT